MSGILTLKCPDRENGTCPEFACSGFLERPRPDGLDKNCDELFAGTCTFCGRYQVFHDLKPWTGSVSTTTPVPFLHQAPSSEKSKRTRITYTEKQAQTILEFVEQTEFDTGREYFGKTCYDLNKAARIWALTKHPRGFPQTEDEFKRAYKTLTQRRRRQRSH